MHHDPSYPAFFIMAEQIQHLHVTYNDIHDLIRQNTPKIAREFNPDLLIAIGLYQVLADSFRLSNQY